MKKILYVALFLCAVSCTTEHDLGRTLQNVVETGADMAMDSLHHVANQELKQRTGIDSLATKIRAADTINVEREVKRALIEELSK